MNEAAEARDAADSGEKSAGGKKKALAAPAKKKTVKKKSRAKPVERRKIVWVIFNNTQKEEDRFPFEQKKAAEERLEVLRSKSKRLYWLQPIKEVIGIAPAAAITAADEAYVPEVEEEVDIDLEDEEEEEQEEEDDYDE
jgi:hypothetical protein